MKRKAEIILLTTMIFVALIFYWVTDSLVTRVAELESLVDLQQTIIAEQMVVYATDSLEYKGEIAGLYQMLQQQSDTIRRIDSELEQAGETITTLEAEIDSYKFIGDWAYKPWQSKAELKDWLKANDVSEQEFSDDNDCDNFSYALFWDALADNRVIGIMREDRHRFNFADVWNTIFRIEPQNDKITEDGVVD